MGRKLIATSQSVTGTAAINVGEGPFKERATTLIDAALVVVADEGRLLRHGELHEPRRARVSRLLPVAHVESFHHVACSHSSFTLPDSEQPR